MATSNTLDAMEGGGEDPLNTSRSSRMAWQDPIDGGGLYVPQSTDSPSHVPSVYEDGQELPVAMEGESRHLGQGGQRRRGAKHIGFYDHFASGVRSMWRTKESDNVRYDAELMGRTVIRELVFYLLFLLVLCFITFGSTSSAMFYFTKTMQQTFIDREGPAFYKTFGEISDMDDFWNYLEGPLINGLYFSKGYNGMRQNYPGFIHHENRLLGMPRIRMHRVRMNQECEIPSEMEKLNLTICYSEYEEKAIEKAAGDIGDKDPSLINAWHYNDPERLGSGSYLGKLNRYNGGGYHIDLRIDRVSSKQQVAFLKQHRWVDRSTRVLFVDFTVYNANLNLFSVVKLVFELPGTGGVIPSFQISTMKLIRYVSLYDHLILLCELIFCMFVIYYIVEELIEILRHGCSYFGGFWNILDIVVILASVFCIVFSIYRQFAMDAKLTVLLQTPWQYVNFENITFSQRRYNDAVAILVFFAWIKLFKYVSFTSAMEQMMTTMERCGRDLASFAIMFALAFAAYSHAGYILFGHQVEDYSSLYMSMFTLMRMMFGDFDFQAMERSNGILGPLYFGSYVFFIFVILLNVFLAIINDTYGEVKAELERRNNKFGIANYFSSAYRNAVKKMNLSGDRGRDIHEALLAADENKDCTIDYDEWRKEMTKRGYAEGEIEAVFNKYDTDGNGVLSMTEQRRMEDDYAAGLLFATDESAAELAAIDARDMMDERQRLDGDLKLKPVNRTEFTLTTKKAARTEEKLMKLIDQLERTVVKLQKAEQQRIDHRQNIIEVIARANQSADMTISDRIGALERDLKDELNRYVDERLE